MTFGESPSGQTRLFSLGKEGRVVEYDLNKSSLSAGLCLVYYQDFAPTSTPCALSVAPPLQYFKHHSAETLLLIADDAYKIRVYNPDMQATVRLGECRGCGKQGRVEGGELGRRWGGRRKTSLHASLALYTA